MLLSLPKINMIIILLFKPKISSEDSKCVTMLHYPDTFYIRAYNFIFYIFLKISYKYKNYRKYGNLTTFFLKLLFYF